MNDRIIGYVTSFSPERVKGFAFKANSNKEVTVDLFLNNQFIARQVANEVTPMLQRQGIEENRGFHFDLKNLGAFHQNDVLEVRTHDQILPNTPKLQFQLLKLGYERQGSGPMCFFMHVPKTAGTSFRFMLYRVFDQETIWPNKSDLAQNGKRYPGIPGLKTLNLDILKMKQLVMGHYPLWTLKYFPVRPKVITFLREPSEQFLSLANHKRSRLEHLKNKKLDDILVDNVMFNPQTYFFLPGSMSSEEISNETFDIALRNLRSCAFVGITERFSESIKNLERMFGWDLGRREKKNIGTPTPLSSKQREIIEKKTYWDRKLYKEAIRIFEDQLKSI